ncbi:MAG: hypothetical protein CJBNEKGG_03561 [Prosthecobacter sp.]|nr:hypothetical protein [Prosthecobacter sp.]
MLSGIGISKVIPSIKISVQNPSGYPQWIECNESFPSRLREIAYEEGKFYTRRINHSGTSTVEMEDSVVSLCDRLAGELIQGWFD